MIKIRVQWETEDEIEQALEITNEIDEMITPKFYRTRNTNDPFKAFGIDIHERKEE